MYDRHVAISCGCVYALFSGSEVDEWDSDSGCVGLGRAAVRDRGDHHHLMSSDGPDYRRAEYADSTEVDI